MSSPRGDAALPHRASFGLRIAELMSRSAAFPGEGNGSHRLPRCSNESATDASLPREPKHYNRVAALPGSVTRALSPPSTYPVIHTTSIHTTPKRVLKVPTSRPIVRLGSPQSAQSPPVVSSPVPPEANPTTTPPVAPPPIVVTVDVQGIAFTDLDAALSLSAVLVGGLRLPQMINKDLLAHALMCDWDAMLMRAELSFSLAENCQRTELFPRRCDDDGVGGWAARLVFHFQPPPATAMRSAVARVIATCLADRASTHRTLCSDGDALLKEFAKSSGTQFDPTVCSVSIEDHTIQRAGGDAAASLSPLRQQSERSTQTEVSPPPPPPPALTQKPDGTTAASRAGINKRNSDRSNDDDEDEDEIRTPIIVRNHSTKPLFSPPTADGPSAATLSAPRRPSHLLSSAGLLPERTSSPRTPAAAVSDADSSSNPRNKRRPASSNSRPWQDNDDENHAVYIVGSATYNPLDFDVMVPVSLLLPRGPSSVTVVREQVFRDAEASLNGCSRDDALAFVKACASSLTPPHEITVKHVAVFYTWEVLHEDVAASSHDVTDVLVTLRHTFLLDSSVEDAAATVSVAILRRDADILRSSFRRALQQLMLMFCAASSVAGVDSWSIREIPASLAGCGTRLSGNVLMPVPTSKLLPMHLTAIEEPVEPSGGEGNVVVASHAEDRLAASGSWGDLSPRKHAPPHPLETHRGMPATAQPTAAASRRTVSLHLVFPHLAWTPLSESLQWWDTHANHRSTGRATRPTEQLIRAIQFDILDAMQEFCCEPEDCVVRFAVSSPSQFRVGVPASRQAVSLPVPVDGVLEVVVELTLPSGELDLAAFQRAALDMCVRPTSFGALLDVYAQLCHGTPTEGVVISTTVDRDESTIDGVPLSSRLRDQVSE